MSAELASSPVVRGLRVVRTNEYRRLSIWKNLVTLLLGSLLPVDEHHWSVLSVRSGSDLLATRRFDNDEVADQVRTRFVAVVTEMCEEQFALADWQAVLDAIPVERR